MGGQRGRERAPRGTASGDEDGTPEGREGEGTGALEDEGPGALMGVPQHRGSLAVGGPRLTPRRTSDVQGDAELKGVTEVRKQRPLAGAADPVSTGTKGGLRKGVDHG